ncbi:MAG: stage V sporulation protein SpoVM [Dethiobacter sp.]|nr:stage V sporulation protein SpoVM [Dethiobacter sp.]MBS3901374.1 stage V sporulation protein SpoVM [Dethiobacter sp.]MBS3990285.1 stage V sporulation protein SpoVM [Dethiobacter sp.]
MDFTFGFRLDLGRLVRLSGRASLLEGRITMRFYTIKVPRFIAKILETIFGIGKK